MKKVVIFSGKFQPPHPGHISAVQLLHNEFPDADVYVEATEKIDGVDRPFSCDDKKEIFSLVGIGGIVYCVKMPYQYTEAQNLLNLKLDQTILIYAVGEKDMIDDQRFKFKPKRDGNPSYLRPFPADGNFLPASRHGYCFTVPTTSFTINMPDGASYQFSSSTDVRDLFRRSNEEGQKSIISSLYGKYDAEIHRMMAKRLLG